MQTVYRFSSGVVRYRFVLTLSLLAVLSIAGYVAQQGPIQAHHASADLVNISSRARAFSQRVALLAEQWVGTSDMETRRRAKAELVTHLRMLEVAHDLMKVWQPRHVWLDFKPDEGTPAGVPTLDQLNQKIQDYVDAARAVARQPESDLQDNSPEMILLRQEAIESPLFSTLDDYVLRCQRTVEEDIARSQRAAKWVLGFTLLALIMTAFFIFRPTEQMVRQELDRLHEINTKLEQRTAEATAAGEQQAQALARSEDHLRQLSRAVEQSPSVVLITDTEGKIDYVNPKFTELTGYTQADVMGKTPRLLKSGRMTSEVYAAMWKTITSGGEWRGELLNKKKNGELYWGSALVSPIRDAAGRITHYLEVVEDITERKRAEEERWRASTFLDSIIENIPDMIFVKDADSLRFVRFNRAGEELIGYARGDMIGKNDYDFFPKDEADHFTSKDREVLQGNSLVDIPEEVIQTRDRGLRILHTKKIPIVDEIGKPTHLLGISEDITDRRRAEEKQRAATEGLRAVLQIADELMACPDVDDMFRRAVELAREKLGLERCGILVEERDAVRGTYGTNRQRATVDEHANAIPLTDLWRERFRVRQPHEQRWSMVEEPHYEWNGEKMIKIGRGWVCITPIQSSVEQEAVGVFCNDAAVSGAEPDPVNQDIVAVYCSLLGNIVARKRAERERWQSEKKQREYMERTDRLNSLGLLAAGMAHEINNPLQGMLSHLHAVQRVLPEDASGQKSLVMVQRGIETIASLVRKLLVMGSTQEQAGSVTVCGEAIEFVAQLMDAQFRKAHIKIIKKSAQPKVSVSMPRRELIQVMLNLMINARDAMPDGGTITIAGDADAEAGIITIQDTGPGISPDIMRDIFTPFFTTKGTEGTGLGLSVAESLVRSSGGLILVDSMPGQGTCFTLRIPLARGGAS